MSHTNPRSNVPFFNDEASPTSQFKVIHRFADSYQRLGEKAPEAVSYSEQTCSAGQASQPVSRPFHTVSQTPRLSTDSMYMAAIRLKSANKHIFRALLSLASAALLTRIFGMLNQVVVTSHFGAGAIMDAYFVASNVPTLMALLIGSAIESSVIPVYARVRSQGDKEQTSILFSTLLNILIVGAILFTAVMLIFSHQIILMSAPGLDALRLGLASNLTLFIYPVLVPMVVIGFLECILNAEGQFGWPAYAGLLVPVTTAILVLLVGKSQGVIMLCVGMLVGLCLQLCVVILRARRAGLVYRPILNLRIPEIGSILTAAWPVLLGSLISQGSPLIDQIFASSLSAGSISALNYALKLISVPTGVIFVSVGRAALPYLSRQAGLKDMKAFKETLRLYLWIVGMGTTMLSICMFVLAHPIVQILFQRGAFSTDDTNRTAIILMGFIVGLTPMAFGFITAKTFSALGKTRVLMYSTIFTVIANAIFDYIFARLWQGFGIALATSAVYFCTMFILLFTLSHTIGKLNLFTPPKEILNVIEKVKTSYSLHQQVALIGIMLMVFAVGVFGVFLNSLYTLRIALGSSVILLLLRHRYALLLVWVLYPVVVHSNPILSGNNVLTGLIAPILLLMTSMPINQAFKRLPALALLLICILWMFTGIYISPIGIGAALTKWTIYLTYVALGVLAINVLTTRRRILLIIDIMLLSGTFVALYGIYGYITRQNGDVDPQVGFRIMSIFHSSPSLALFLSLVIPLAFYRALTTHGLKLFGYSLLIPILLIALVLTFTRGAFISMPLSIIVIILLLPSRKMRVRLLSSIFGLSALAVLAAIVGKVPILNRFFNADLATLNGRTYIWQALVSNFDPTQLLGRGLEASNIFLANSSVASIATAPHNLFLGALYDHGIIGAALLMLVFIVLLANLIAGMRKASGERRMLFVAALAVFFSVLFLSLDNSDLWIEDFSIYFWIIMALPFAPYWSTLKQPSNTYEDISDRGTVPQMEIIQLTKSEQLSRL